MRKFLFLTTLSVVALLAAALLTRSGKVPMGLLAVSSQPAAPQIEARSKVPGVTLNHCSDGELGVRFLCDFGWQQRKFDGILLFTIASDPAVKMKIVRIDMDILYIHQLSRDSLADLGRYAKGFVTEEVTVAGQNAIKVKAFALGDPGDRLCDYYFVHNKALYGLMFSVAPKDRWDDYQFLFQDIVDHFRF